VNSNYKQNIILRIKKHHYLFSTPAALKLLCIIVGCIGRKFSERLLPEWSTSLVYH